MKICDLTAVLENFAPIELAEDWDRVGLMVGSWQRECSGVVLALDMTYAVAEQAVKSGANLIITHHPFIWDALRRIDVDTPMGKAVELLIKNDITVYSMHTNLDKTVGGLNFTAARLFGGSDVSAEGIGVLANMGGVTLGELVRRVATVLGDDTVTFVGNPDKRVDTAYIVTGNGSGEYDEVKHLADVFITGEFRHHQYLDAVAEDVCLIEFSHYHSEIIMQDILYDLLKATGVNIIRAKSNRPFRRLQEI